MEVEEGTYMSVRELVVKMELLMQFLTRFAII